MSTVGRLVHAVVSVSSTLQNVLLALDRGSVEVALVTDDAKRLVGIFTDGDVRRALLKGASLAAPLLPYMRRDFNAVGPQVGRAEVLDLMQARTIGQVPILDSQGRLIGLHLLHEMLGHSERSNWAVVMAGGRGTRLGPLTEKLPKPMIRVAGRPILERIVLQLVSVGVRRIFLAVNYLGQLIEEHFGDGARFGCRIEYLREDRPLGTGGALSLLPDISPLPLLVVNGDLVTQARFGDMLDYHDRGCQKVTMAVRRYFHTVPFGCVESDGENIVRIEEKPTMSRLINAGIYVLSPDLISRVPRDQVVTLPDLILDSLQQGEKVCAYEIAEDWIDVGQKEQLTQARGMEPELTP